VIEMNRDDLLWMVGLIEGEGTFGINICIRPGGGFAISPTFKLALASKDKDVVLLVKKLLGFGRVSFKSKEVWLRRGMKNAQDQYLYIVNKIDDVQKFIEIFDENLFRTSKKLDYLLWKEAVEIIRSYKHLSYNGFIRLCEIRDQMNLKQKKKNYKNKNWFLNLIKQRPDLFSEKNVEKRKRQSQSIRRLVRLAGIVG
jgi:hypothetical protein